MNPQLPPPVEEFLPLARRMAEELAWNPSDQDDLIQEGLLQLHVALSRVAKVEKPLRFARKVLLRSMMALWRPGKSPDLFFSVPVPPLTPTVPSPTPLDSLWFGEYLEGLESALGEEYREIAEELLFPGEWFGGFVLEEVEKKCRQREEDPSRQLRGVEKIRISQRQLQEALGLSIPLWQETVEQIRSWTFEWLKGQDLALPEKWVPREARGTS